MTYESIRGVDISKYNQECGHEVERLYRLTMNGIAALPRTPFNIGNYIEDIASSVEKEGKVRNLLAQIEASIPLDSNYEQLYVLVYVYYNSTLNSKLNRDRDRKIKMILAATTFKRSGIRISRIIG